MHKLIHLKLTPNSFLFKLKTMYTVMSGILITSVFTWRFVYLTVLFFLLFSSIVAISGWMIHSLAQEADSRAAGLWVGGDDPLQSVRSRRTLTKTSTCPLPLILSGWRRWRAASLLFFFPFVVSTLTIQVFGPRPLLLWMMVNWLRTWTSGCCHQATQSEVSWVARCWGLPAHSDWKSHCYLWLHRAGG